MTIGAINESQRNAARIAGFTFLFAIAPGGIDLQPYVSEES